LQIIQHKKHDANNDATNPSVISHYVILPHSITLAEPSLCVQECNEPIALVTLETVFERLPMIMFDVLMSVRVGDLRTSIGVTMSQSSGTKTKMKVKADK